MASSVRSLVFVGLVAVLGASGCGAPAPVEGGLGLLLGEQGSLMTDVERDARDLLEDMALVVSANATQPEVALARLDAFLDVNGERLIASALRVEARYRSLGPREARIWEAQFGEYMLPAWRAWQQAEVAVSRVNREWSHRISGRVHAYDQSAEGRAIRDRLTAP